MSGWDIIIIVAILALLTYSFCVLYKATKDD
jgi:hypothetical protein